MSFFRAFLSVTLMYTYMHKVMPKFAEMLKRWI